jgi:nicotinamide-nucleotide amidase
MEKVFASIITIGDELLIGQVIDTNSAWMAQELNKNRHQRETPGSCGRCREDIWQALDEESKQASLILITGGLGPTADDITKPLLCDYFGGKMVVINPHWIISRMIFERVFKRPWSNAMPNRPKCLMYLHVLKNEKGTAPGMLFKKDGKDLYFSYPVCRMK